MVENKNIEKLKISLLNTAKNLIDFDINKNIKFVQNNFSEVIEIKKYLEVLR